ncbi:hypothetical protein HYT55_05225 [Candidatus Woesearchaeota archaeon]|nr:hypothetical protein [Candidatus Woesearchaeota archaeon]
MSLDSDLQTKAYNLLWVAPRLPEQRVRYVNFQSPMPAKTVENVRGIAQRNKSVDVRLWVDSERITAEQYGWLEKMTKDCPSRNLSLSDLRMIAEYREEELYRQPDTNPDWRANKQSLIWRQVDAARILVCLQGDYDQIFYSDADVKSLRVNARKVQRPLQKYGMVFCYHTPLGIPENGLFGFTRREKDSFRRLYNQTVRYVKDFEHNGYHPYVQFLDQIEMDRGIPSEEMRFAVFVKDFDGTEAVHPGLLT